MLKMILIFNFIYTHFKKIEIINKYIYYINILIILYGRITSYITHK
jgi:hypothetical protein